MTDYFIGADQKIPYWLRFTSLGELETAVKFWY